LSGSERGRSATVIWKRYCGTAAKAGGNGENKLLPVVTGVSCLLENTGIMGFGELTEWVIGKINLTNHKRNEKFGSNPFGRRRICIIPLFHHSIIPCVRQDYQASVNTYNFNRL
jgi:hypothetical protein